MSNSAIEISGRNTKDSWENPTILSLNYLHLRTN
jgi:hypothetical protein